MYCGKCGNELTEIDKFCPKCGKAVYVDIISDTNAIDNNIITNTINNNVISDTNTIDNNTITNQSNINKKQNVKIIGIVVLAIFIILIGTSLHSNISNIRKDTQNELTGIEQAIKDGMIGEDYLTQGVSESQLYFTFTDGNLQMYYDNWEDCLADAKKLNIITSNEEYLTMEEVLDKEKCKIYHTYHSKNGYLRNSNSYICHTYHSKKIIYCSYFHHFTTKLLSCILLLYLILKATTLPQN